AAGGAASAAGPAVGGAPPPTSMPAAIAAPAATRPARTARATGRMALRWVLLTVFDTFRSRPPWLGPRAVQLFAVRPGARRGFRGTCRDQGRRGTGTTVGRSRGRRQEGCRL